MSAAKVQSRSLENEQKPRLGGRGCDDVELVKHMSTLPGFLQQVEKESTIQGKALNFGVLDWKRLEKWKYTERMPRKVSKKAPLGGASFVSASGLTKIRTPPQSLYLRTSNGGRNDSYWKEAEYVERFKSKGKETSSKNHTAESIKIGRQGQFSDQIRPEANVYRSKRSSHKEMMLEGEEASSLSSKQGKHKIGKKSEIRFDEVELTSECSITDPLNIMFLTPKDAQEKSLSESSQLKEFRTSVDAQLPATARNRLPDFCSLREMYSAEYSIDIPHSCPLPCSEVDRHEKGAYICPSAGSITSSEAKFSDTSEEITRPSFVLEASSRKQGGVGEKPTVRGRSLSPTRWLSYNLGRMAGSVSSKESSAAPQLSSNTTVKSCPVRPQIAPSGDDFERDQSNVGSRARSSPLRRLLDPLLKHKTSGGTVRPLNGSLRATTVSPTTTTTALPFQALLQLTFKNGLPFFKLVAENSNDMLAAAMKRLPAAEKSDSRMIYSFYSVQENKKRIMNWTNHGSKSKLSYSIIGQMKISNFHHLKRSRGDDSECDATECVLYGVDPGQIEKQMLPFVPNKEIAAIVVKSKNQLPRGKKLPKLASPTTLQSQEKEDSNSTVVILPGSVHGIPIKGAPSSLISRWRSGGSCDCGGWDVGCKLHILANDTQEPRSGSVDQVNLFMESAEHTGLPVFSLRPFSDELYSIEFDASISLLEGFAISVACIASRKVDFKTTAFQ